MDSLTDMIFFLPILITILGLVWWASKCTHDWELVLETPDTKVYRCTKCGKEKRYVL